MQANEQTDKQVAWSGFFVVLQHSARGQNKQELKKRYPKLIWDLIFGERQAKAKEKQL